MNDKNISKIANRILNKADEYEISLFPLEESKGFYKNVYKIKNHCKVYVLKQAKEKELDLYSSLNNTLECIPHFYGSYRFYKRDYILVDFFDGYNAMRLNRNNLIKIIDAIIIAQKRYWLSNETFGITFDDSFSRKEKLIDFIPDELKETYNLYLDNFKNAPRTFSHEDLLPFNVLINNERVCFIDLEVGGILPYPTMIARLIAFTEEDDNALFYLKKEDYLYALTYYYDVFIKNMGISKKNYLLTMELFIFNELLEFVWTYRKYDIKPDDRYNKMYDLAIKKQIELKDIC